MTSLFLAVAETSLLTGLAIAPLAALLPRLRQRYAAAGRRLLWLLLTLRLLCPVRFPWQTSAPVTITLPSAAGLPVDAALVTSTPAAAPAVVLPSPLMLLALLWLAGAMCILLWQVSGYLRFRRELHRWATPVESGPVLDILAEQSAGLGLRRAPVLLLDRQGRGPLLTGFFRPAIVLPELDLPEKDLRFILAHELTHYKHRDLWFHLLLLLASAFHWFNPAVWLLRQAAVDDLELACDDAVLRAAGDGLRRAYCETILSAVHRGNARANMLTTSFQGGVREMKQRFLNIFQAKKKRGLWLSLPVLALAVLLGALVSCSTAPEADLAPVDLTVPAPQSSPGSHHGEPHNPDHHTSQSHDAETGHHEEEHHITVDSSGYVEYDPGISDPSQLQTLPAYDKSLVYDE